MSAHTLLFNFPQEYPFGKGSMLKCSPSCLQVCQVINLTSDSSFTLQRKNRILQTLDCEYLIRPLFSSLHSSRLEITFQYVSESFEKISAQSSDPMMESVRRQLTFLAQKLVEYSIKHSFRLQNVGLSSEKTLKYFLGLDFSIDRDIDHEDLMAKYLTNIDEILLQKLNRVFQDQIRRTSYRNERYYNTQNTQKSYEAIKGIKQSLKKSRIEADQALSLVTTKKPLGLGQQSSIDLAKIQAKKIDKPENHEEKTSQIKLLKIEELGLRINKLKECMKGMLGKTPPNNSGLFHMLMRIDNNNPGNRTLYQSKFYISPNYTKFEKKIAEFRQNQLIRAQKRQQTFFKDNNKGYQINSTIRFQDKSRDVKLLANNTLKKQKPINSRLSHHVLTNHKNSPYKEPNSPSSDKNKLHSCFTAATTEDQRKLREYWEFASKDKYCEEFMYFLEEDHSINEEKKLTAFSASQSRAHSTTNSTKSIQSNACNPDKKELGIALDYISTEYSQRSASDLHATVQKVIRNSMKIINGIKSKQCS